MNGSDPHRRFTATKRFWTLGAVVLLGAALVLAVGFLGDAPRGTPVVTDADLHAVRNVRGNPSAPVKLVEYGDYL